MKTSKSNLDLQFQGRTNGLAYVLMYALAHLLLLVCIVMLHMHYFDILDDLVTMKILISGHIVISMFILLPIASLFGKSEHPPQQSGPRIKGHKGEKSKSSIGTLIFPIALFISSIAMFHFISVLFGAPLIRDIERTCHFAALLSSAAVLPGIIVYGCSFDKWVQVFIHNGISNTVDYIVQLTSMTSVIGAWLGAFPIPLDWDRPWQIWPISCVIGTVLGHGVGLYGGILYIQYMKMRYGKKRT